MLQVLWRRPGSGGQLLELPGAEKLEDLDGLLANQLRLRVLALSFPQARHVA